MLATQAPPGARLLSGVQAEAAACSWEDASTVSALLQLEHKEEHTFKSLQSICTGCVDTAWGAAPRRQRRPAGAAQHTPAAGRGLHGVDTAAAAGRRRRRQVHRGAADAVAAAGDRPALSVLPQVNSRNGQYAFAFAMRF